MTDASLAAGVVVVIILACIGASMWNDYLTYKLNTKRIDAGLEVPAEVKAEEEDEE